MLSHTQMCGTGCRLFLPYGFMPGTMFQTAVPSTQHGIHGLENSFVLKVIGYDAVA